MNASTTNLTKQFTACASLAAIGVKLGELDLFGPIRQRVRIAQKTVKYAPIDKVYDAFISLLAGAQSVVEINTRRRADPALQTAFGRSGCAEQSVVQQTLDACTTENVQQLEQGLDTIYREHSQGYRHDSAHDWQVLDVDMSGLPCGPKAAFASKGSFAKQRNRRGRQLGRVLASRYGEIVTDRLFDGTTQLTKALQPLMRAAEQTLGLDEGKRARTMVRLDAGGGSLDDVKWLLSRGSQVHCKDSSSTRAQRLAESVSYWVDDPQVPGRQVGWVRLPAPEYVRPVRRIAVRCRKQNGQWAVAVLIAALSPAEVLALSQQTRAPNADPAAVLLAYVAFYDQRGGGVETSFKGDKQGLGLTQRSKNRFAAQQMLILLGALAHNVVAWARRWLATPPVLHAKLPHYGTLRMVRDVFHISGFLVLDASCQIVQIVLNPAAPLAGAVADALRQLLTSAHVAISLVQT
jgi:hypothetical protein